MSTNNGQRAGRGATEIFQIPALSDNYVYILRQGALTAVVDPSAARGVIDFLEARGWKLDFIFNTHHHRDHVGGNLELQKRYGCEIYGNETDRARIPGLTRAVHAGESFRFGTEEVRVFGADGHTHGHIVYWLPESHALFCGDVIFSLGCGKLFEGTAEEMWVTLARLRELPDDTLVYCAHEYTLENSEFAIRVDAANPLLVERIAEASAQREAGKSTVPSTLGSEKAANPFLRPESASIQRAVKLGADEPLWKIFGATRALKDAFDGGQSI